MSGMLEQGSAHCTHACAWDHVSHAFIIFHHFPLQVGAYRRQLEVVVSGFEPPKPVKTFEQCGFEPALMAAITKAG